MENLRLVDMTYMLAQLRLIKKPSAQIKRAIEKLESDLCRSIMNIRQSHITYPDAGV